nr:hypothetical protein [uncultured Undibacterium sp.]
MKKTVVYFLLIALSSILSACGLNNVKKLNSDATINPYRSIIIYGIRVEGRWDAPMFSVDLSEYDLKLQAITGNCFRYNHTEAMIPSVAGNIHFFAFEVQSEHFVVSPFNTVHKSFSTTAFNAPKGKAVYIGTFLYDQKRTLNLQRDFEPVASQLQSHFPKIGNTLKISETLEVTHPRGFLCTP